MSDGPLVDEVLRRRMTEVAARYADGVPVDGAARARRTARRRAVIRTGAVAVAVLAAGVGLSVAVLDPLSADRGMVVPVVTPAPEPTVVPTPVEEPTAAPTAAPTSQAPGTTDTTSLTVTTRAPAASTTGTVPDDEVPGVPAQSGVPAAGSVLIVVGVAGDDVLNIRSVPGGDVVGAVGPTGEVTATGRARDLDGRRWVEVAAGDSAGWVAGRFLAAGTGGVEDLTALAVERHAGVPTADSMAGLGRIVADALAPDGAEPRVTVLAEPTSGDLEEMTVDVLGLEDDAVVGYRLRVFATEDAGVYTLRTVEATSLCSRAVDPDGLCV